MNMECISIYFSFLQFLSVLFVAFTVKSGTSLVKFIPKYCILFDAKYFILFDAIIDGIVFLISFLDCSLLIIEIQMTFVYWSCIIQLLLNLFISWNSIFVDLILYVRSCHLWIELVLLLPFQGWMLFFFFSCLIALARTSSTVLTRSDKSECPSCSLKGKLSGHHHWVWF